MRRKKKNCPRIENEEKKSKRETSLSLNFQVYIQKELFHTIEEGLEPPIFTAEM